MQVDGEAGPPVAVDDLGSAVGKHPTAGGAAGDCVEAPFEVDAAGLGKDERLAHRQTVADDQYLVDQLDGLTRALFADVRYRIAHRLKHAPGAFDLVLVAADHDAERPVGCAFAAAADGRVEHLDALGAQLLGDIDGRLRADRAEIDDQRAGLNAGKDAVLAENDLLDVRRIADADGDNVAVGSNVGRAGACRRARLDQGVHAA